MSVKKYYVEELDKVIREYADKPSPNRLYSVLCGLFEGIEENYSLPCPAEMNLEDGNVAPLFLKKENGKEHLAVLTSLDGEKFLTVADVKLRSIVQLVFSMKDCEGIIFNPTKDSEFFVPKQFLAYALAAGYKMAEDDYEIDEQ